MLDNILCQHFRAHYSSAATAVVFLNYIFHVVTVIRSRACAGVFFYFCISPGRILFVGTPVSFVRRTTTTGVTADKYCRDTRTRSWRLRRVLGSKRNAN